MLFYRNIPKEYSGGLVGLNIFSGTVGMLLVSKTSSLMNKYISKEAIYAVGALLILGYVIFYLIYTLSKMKPQHSQNKIERSIQDDYINNATSKT